MKKEDLKLGMVVEVTKNFCAASKGMHGIVRKIGSVIGIEFPAGSKARKDEQWHACSGAVPSRIGQWVHVDDLKPAKPAKPAKKPAKPAKKPAPKPFKPYAVGVTAKDSKAGILERAEYLCRELNRVGKALHAIKAKGGAK